MKRATSIQYPSTSINLTSIKNRLRRTTSIPSRNPDQRLSASASNENSQISEESTITPGTGPGLTQGPKRSNSEHFNLSQNLTESIRSSLSRFSGQNSRTDSQDSSLLDLTSTKVSQPEEAQELQWTIWSRALNDFENFSKDNPENLKIMVYNGIPLHFRAMAWQLLSGAEKSPYKEKYSELLKLDSPNEKLILRDISRTYPDHPNFSDDSGLAGRDCLFNVMKAYSLIDTEVGYCQGLCFIVGLLLMHVPEEDAFTIFCELMLNKKFGLRDLYKPGMAQLALKIYQLNGLLQDHAPELSSHFIAQGLDLSSFVSSWFLTIFTTTFSIPCCSRILDCLLMDGPEIIFKISLSILLIEQDKLLELDMEEILLYLNKEAPKIYEKDPSLLIQNAQNSKNIVINERRMKKLERDFFEKKSREARELAEMRRLRDNNELMKERIDALEKENVNLTKKMAAAKWTTTVIQKKEMNLKEEVENLRRENERLKSQVIDVTSSESPSITTQPISNNSSIFLNDAQSNSDQNFVLQLQEELVAARLREACLDERVSEMDTKLQQAEKRVSELDTNKQLIQSQQEVVKIKIRFAECQNSYQELQERLAEIEETINLQKANPGNARVSTAGSAAFQVSSSFNINRSKSISSRRDMNSSIYKQSFTQEANLHNELLSYKLKEAKLAVVNKDQSMKIIELQQWCDHLNEQISKNSMENSDLKFKLQEMEEDIFEKEASVGHVRRSNSRINRTTRRSINSNSSHRDKSRDKESTSNSTLSSGKQYWLTAKDILSARRKPIEEEPVFETALEETKI